MNEKEDMILDQRCWLYDGCPCRSGGCFGLPDDGCPVYIWFEKLIKDRNRNAGGTV